MKKKMIRVGRTVCHEGFQEIYEHSGNTLGTEGNTADFLLIFTCFFVPVGVRVPGGARS